MDQVRAEFGIPSDYDPVAVIAIGYPGDPSVLPDHLRERETKPRERKPISDFVFSAVWGEASPLVR